MKKTAKQFLCLTLCCTSLLTTLPLKADAQTTNVSVTFTEAKEVPKTPVHPTAPNGELPITGEVPSGEEVVYRQSGLSGTGTDRKRLPTTNDQYNQVLTQLGYLVSLAWLFFFILGKRKEQKIREDHE